MIRCIKTSFSCNKDTLDKLFECNRISAQIWNDCLYYAKDYSIKNGGKWINKSQLQALLKKKYPLHSQSIQSVAHKYLFSRDSSKKAIDKGIKTVKYPYKTKKHFNTKWVDKAFKVINNKIQLSNGTGNPKLYLSVHKDISNIDIKEIELIYDRGLKLSISYDDNISIIDNKHTNQVGVDLGEIHSISAYCDNGNSLIITGRKIRSINRFRNKKLKELQKKMSKCKKHSRQWKKYNKAKQYILSKSNNQLKDCLHKTSKQFIDWCNENKVKEIAIGDLGHIAKGTKKKLRKITTQKLSNWNYGQLETYIKYKSEVYDIKIKKQDESYTTQQCPCCGRRKKPSNRNYICICGYKAHRDIHGARNILSKYKYKKITYIGDIKEIKYLRVA